MLNLNKRDIKLSEEQRKAVERELSAGNNVELFYCDKGVVIKRIRRETVKQNITPINKTD